MILIDMKTVKLKGGFVVTGKGVERTDIILRDGRIVLAGDKERCDEIVDITGKYVVPGFVDIHFHGYNLFEFTAGLYDVETETFDDSPSAYDYGFEMLSSTLIKFGVTGFYVGTWASPIENLRKKAAFLILRWRVLKIRIMCLNFVLILSTESKTKGPSSWQMWYLILAGQVMN
jgi:N-acetylglucosamine-6-phosphate deacetylase